jgi:hypothetical protein
MAGGSFEFKIFYHKQNVKLHFTGGSFPTYDEAHEEVSPLPHTTVDLTGVLARRSAIVIMSFTDANRS